MKFSLTFATAILAGSFLIAQNSLQDRLIKSNYSLENSKIPTYMEFDSKERPQLSQLNNLFAGYWKSEPNFSFLEIGREVDQLGFTHIRYEQTYKSIPIEFAELIVHTKNNLIYSMNGKLIDKAPAFTENSIEESVALSAAKNHIGASSYKWEIPSEEAHLKAETKNNNATYFPLAELKYISSAIGVNPLELRLTYKFNIYAQEPLSRQEVYVDASNGSIVFTNNLIHTVNVPGTAVTAYSGNQTINVDSINSNTFRLRQTLSGGGIYTFNLQQGTNYSNAVDFTDADNFWNNANANQDEYATDAHWGAEQTYDYFFTNFNRNSINNQGFALNSYIHYSTNFANAFWDGQRMTYGDGSGSISPLVALDIAGHEITHGLTTFSANLVYASESGALNESFSDVFGAAIEFYARPNNANWLIGEDIGSTLRSMSNPNLYGDPDTRGGNNWGNVVGCTPTQFNDQCFVHSNSGVQNFWFYLLTTGGTGTNDLGNAYSVTGIGITKAAAVAYRNLTTYLTQSSDYDDARFFAIQSAIDLYGDCSPEVQSVTNAWHAVGVGSSYVPGVTADFTADFTSSCNPPLAVNFTNNSNNGSSFFWDFGDGTTSTAREPSHNYVSYGQFDVKLVADGGLCGIDSITKVGYVDIDTANPCIVILNNGVNATQLECLGKIYDSGGSSGNYSNNENGIITIAPLNAATVTLNFVSFDVEAGQAGACNYDFLEVFDGSSTNAPSLGVFCNNNIPTTITSSNSSITLQFITDIAAIESGFEIDWQCNLPTASPVADFTTSTNTSCDGEVEFNDISSQAPSSWRWDFGDGTISTQQNPIHVYSSNGTFDVKLVATNSFGSDSTTKTNVVAINRPNAPIAMNDSACIGQSASLSATASGSIRWYSNEFGGNSIASGNTITVSNVTSDTTLWAESLIASAIQTVGPTTNTIGTGANFSNDQHLIFDVLDKIELVSVRVYAGSAGNRTIELRDNNGVVLQSLSRFIPAGPFRVTLNFTIDPGTDYQLGVAAGSQPDLYRNNSGTNYPYTIANKVSITGSSAGTNPTGFYYFFYNWRVKSPDCTSARIAATAFVDTTCTITGISEANEAKAGINVYPNPVSNQLNIKVNGEETINTIQVNDLTGKLIYENRNSFAKKSFALDVANWSQGVYFLQVSTPDKTYTQKIIISRN